MSLHDFFEHNYAAACDMQRGIEGDDVMKKMVKQREIDPLKVIPWMRSYGLFQGIHDFAAFGSPMKPGGSTVREVMAVNWYHDGDLFEFEITANAFLYHMVRRLVFVQVKVAQGNLSSDEIQMGLQDPLRSTIQGLAPAPGLRLENVTYRRE